MKSMRPLATAFVLCLAFGVTVGSMYVTVNAAAQQDGTELVPPIPPSIQLDPVANESQPQANGEAPVDGEAAVEAVDEIAPQAVRHGRDHSVQLSDEGGFTGRLSTLAPDGSLVPASNMNVRLIRSGERLASTTTGEDGTFTVSGLSPGVTGLLAFSDTGFVLGSILLVSNEQAFADATPVKLDTAVQLEMNTAVIGPADLATARDLILNGLPEPGSRFQNSLAPEDNEYPLGANEPSTHVSHHQVRLEPDGTLQGELNIMDPRTGRNRPISDLTLHFIRNGEHIGGTEVSQDGSFVMAGLHPGVYGIVTTGADGILAMSVDILGSVAHKFEPGEYKLASASQGLGFSASPCGPDNFNSANANDLSEGSLGQGGGSPLAGADAPFGPMASPAGGPMGMPGSGGSYGGGGGGIGGGGSGWGALAAAALGAAAGYAANDDDRPASPLR